MDIQYNESLKIRNVKALSLIFFLKQEIFC